MRGDADVESKKGQLLLSFGCTAALGVLAASTLAKSWAKCAKEKLNAQGGVLDHSEIGRMLLREGFATKSEYTDKTTVDLYYDVQARLIQKQIVSNFAFKSREVIVHSEGAAKGDVR